MSHNLNGPNQNAKSIHYAVLPYNTLREVNVYTQWCKVTKYINPNTLLKHNCEVLHGVSPFPATSYFNTTTIQR